MEMRIEQQVLTPTVQHRKEADLSADVKLAGRGQPRKTVALQGNLDPVTVHANTRLSQAK